MCIHYTCPKNVHYTCPKKVTPLYIPSKKQLLTRIHAQRKYTIHAQRKWRLYTFHPKNSCWLGQRHRLKYTEHVYFDLIHVVTEHVYFDLIHVVVFMIHTHVHMQDMRNKALNSCTKIHCFIKTSKHLCKYSEQMYFYICMYDKTCKTSH